MKNELKIVEKVFENRQIRTVWNSNEEKFYISVVDIIEVLTDSTEPRKYWNWLKNKLLKEEQFETSSITRQFKLPAKDGNTKLDVNLEKETVWLSLDQMTKLFRRDKSVISRHIKNIFEEG